MLYARVSLRTIRLSTYRAYSWKQEHGMERLTQQDFRGLLEFQRELYIPRDVNAFCAHLIAALPQVVPADLVAYRETNRQKRQTTKELLSPANGGFSGSGRIPISATSQRSRTTCLMPSNGGSGTNLRSSPAMATHLPPVNPYSENEKGGV